MSFPAHKREYFDLNPEYYLHEELVALLEGHFESLPYERQRGYYLAPGKHKRENLLGWWW